MTFTTIITNLSGTFRQTIRLKSLPNIETAISDITEEGNFVTYQSQFKTTLRAILWNPIVLSNPRLNEIVF